MILISLLWLDIISVTVLVSQAVLAVSSVKLYQVAKHKALSWVALSSLAKLMSSGSIMQRGTALTTLIPGQNVSKKKKKTQVKMPNQIHYPFLPSCVVLQAFSIKQFNRNWLHECYSNTNVWIPRYLIHNIHCANEKVGQKIAISFIFFNKRKTSDQLWSIFTVHLLEFPKGSKE